MKQLKKTKCLNCGRMVKPAYDPIAKKITGYLYRCPCGVLMSKG